MAKKIHRLLAEACVQTLERIFHGGMVADREVKHVLGTHPKWGARDRAFVADTIYEVVRWRRRLAWLACAEEDDWKALAGLHWALRDYPRPEWGDWPEVSTAVREERLRSLATAQRAVRESLSDEFDALGARELGDNWEPELTAMNQAAAVFLRVNPVRSCLVAVMTELTEKGIAVTTVEGAPLALRVEGGRTIPAQLKESGRFEIQDAGSQQVAPFLHVEPGHRVVDACAGAGGKTLHLAALMNGMGELRALDVDVRKLAALKSRAENAGVNVWTVQAPQEVAAQLSGWADRVLIDAPCSGSGTLRRQPDLKYRLTAESLDLTRMLQRELLMRYAQFLRPGGKLVYATCSIFPGENETQAAWFSTQAKDFTMEEERRISPAATGWDGFYMARWRRE